MVFPKGYLWGGQCKDGLGQRKDGLGQRKDGFGQCKHGLGQRKHGLPEGPRDSFGGCLWHRPFGKANGAFLEEYNQGYLS